MEYNWLKINNQKGESEMDCIKFVLLHLFAFFCWPFLCFTIYIEGKRLNLRSLAKRSLLLTIVGIVSYLVLIIGIIILQWQQRGVIVCIIGAMIFLCGCWNFTTVMDDYKNAKRYMAF